MLYVLICTDKPGSLAVRQENRPAHLDFLNSLGPALKAGGPFTADDGEKPNGSLVVIEAASLADARAIAAKDPYAKAGLFQSVDIRPWKWLLKNPESA
ncbi:MAG: YciI family protein [Pseudomonadota bacterium]|nr:YciI family protein [Pseudomonadota bacterium]